jgi:galactokinase
MSPGDTPRPAPPGASFQQVISLFQQTYGIPPAVIASAPGRVNLIGEHLDYNGGPVLPFAIDRRTWVAAGAGTEPMFELVTAQPGLAPVRRPGGPARGDWSDYVVGVARELDGAAGSGARIAVTSELPVGAGLSSSAALAVASAAALTQLGGSPPNAEAVAEAAFRAEHDYVGVRCGRMDQTVVTCATEGNALFLETADGARIACPFAHTVWVVPTGVEHALTGGSYNTRRDECTRALELCRERWPQLAALAELPPSSLPDALALLPPPLDRRTRHVVTETARTRTAKAALLRGDLVELGRLLYAGHASLRDDYECSVPEADFLVELAERHGALGARLTGAGWGGSVIMLVGESDESHVVDRLVADFGRRFGRTPGAWRARASGGVRLDLAS